MAKQKYETIREFIFYAYANLAMAHVAVEKKHEKYGMVHFMIRAKLYKGLKDGTINMKSIFDDEKIKLQIGQFCNYCGSNENLALDHIFPKKKGGQDKADNLILACRACNSSKGKKDLMEWMNDSNVFFPIMIIRRYLKLLFVYCDENRLLDLTIEDFEKLQVLINLSFIPLKYPRPTDLRLTIIE